MLRVCSGASAHKPACRSYLPKYLGTWRQSGYAEVIFALLWPICVAAVNHALVARRALLACCTCRGDGHAPYSQGAVQFGILRTYAGFISRRKGTKLERGIIVRLRVCHSRSLNLESNLATTRSTSLQAEAQTSFPDDLSHTDLLSPGLCNMQDSMSETQKQIWLGGPWRPRLSDQFRGCPKDSQHW